MGTNEFDPAELRRANNSRQENFEPASRAVREAYSAPGTRGEPRGDQNSKNDRAVTSVGLAGAKDLLPAGFVDEGRQLSDVGNGKKQVAAVKYENGSGFSFQRDETGKIIEANHTNAEGRPDQKLKASRDTQLDLKEDGTFVKSTFRTTEHQADEIYDRNGKSIGRQVFESKEKLETETYAKDGSRVIENHKNGTRTEIGKDRFKQTYADQSSREISLDEKGKANGYTWTDASGGKEVWTKDKNSDDFYRSDDTKKTHPWKGSIAFNQDGRLSERSDTGGRREISPTGVVQHFDKEGAQLLTDNVRTKDNRYLVTGADGKERVYVDAEKYDQTPGPPTRPDTPGGKITNESSKPILVVGKGEGYAGNEHGDGFLRVLKPGASSNPGKTDYDGVITEAKFQPVTLPDGKVLMPESVPPQASWTKLRDSYSAVVNDGGNGNDLSVSSPEYTSRFGLISGMTVKDYTGGRKIKPQRPGQLQADVD